MAKYDFDDEDGVWRTVGGRRIFIREGQSLGDAMKGSGKFKSAQKGKAKAYKQWGKSEKELDDEYDKAHGTYEKSAKELDDEYDRAHGAYKKEEDEQRERERKEHRDAIKEENEERMRELEKKLTDKQLKEKIGNDVKKLQDEAHKRGMLPSELQDQLGIKDSDLGLKDDYTEKFEQEMQGMERYLKAEEAKKQTSSGSDKQQSEKYLDRAHREIKETREMVEQHGAEAREELKGYIRDNYKNPDDYLKDYDRENAESRIGTRRDKFDKDDKNSYFSEQHKMEKDARDDVVKMIQEIKDEDRENDRIIAEYERKNSGGKADKVAERLGLRKNDNSKYDDYYKKHQLGTPSNYQKGDEIEYTSVYGNGKGTIVREATDSEKEFQINTNLKGYIVRDKNGSEHVVPDTRIKGGSNNTSNNFESLAKQVVNDNAKGYPYNKISLWPGKEGKYNSETDRWEFHGMKGIAGGQQSTKIEVDRKGNLYEEGKLVNTNSTNTESKSTSNSNTAYKKAFAEYKKQHPNSKLTLNKFIDMSEGK